MGVVYSTYEIKCLQNFGRKTWRRKTTREN